DIALPVGWGRTTAKDTARVDSPGGTSNTLLIRLCPPRAWLRGSVAWLAMAKLCLPDFHQRSGLPGVATYNWPRLKPRFKRAAGIRDHSENRLDALDSTLQREFGPGN